MSHFVFIESNTTGTGLLAVERLLAQEERVTFFTRSREKYSILAPPLHPLLRVHELDTNSLPAVLQAVLELDSRESINAVLTFSDFYVSMAAEAARCLGLPGLNPAAARSCRNKAATRRILKAAGLPTPEFLLVTSEGEALDAARRFQYPCVVKPPRDSSSHGVRLVRNPSELLEHYRALQSWTNNVRGQSVSGEVLVESLLRGPEFSVETFTVPGAGTRVIGVTDKHLSKEPHFVEMGHDFPSRADEHVRGALAQAALNALQAVKFDFGPAHTEIRWTDCGPVVVEINPRLAGGMIPELVQYAKGIDLIQAWLDLARDREADVSTKWDRTASIRFLTAQQAGEIRAVAGIEQSRTLASVREVFSSARIGAIVRPAEDAYDRLGFVIAAGDRPSTVDRDLAKALETIRIEVSRPGRPAVA